MKKNNPYRELLRDIKPPETLQARVRACAQREREGRPRHRFSRSRFLTALAAVCALAILMTAGAAAVVGLSGGWKQFWNGASVPQNAVSALNLTQTVNGYTLAVEDVMAADNRAIVLVTLSRADGRPVDPGIGIGRYGSGANLLLDGDHADLTSRISYPPFMSPGNTAKHWCFEFETDGAKGLTGRTLGIEASQIVQPHTETGVLDGAAVAALYAAEPVDARDSDLNEGGAAARNALCYAIADQQKAASPVHLPLSNTFPEVRLGGAVSMDGGLALAFQMDGNEKPVHNGTACYRVFLSAVTDKRTGERKEYNGSRGIWTDGDPMISYQLCLAPDFSVEDLPNLEIEVSYTLFDILADEPCLLSFKAENKTERSLPLGYEETLGEDSVTLEKMNVSTLGVLLTVRAPEETQLFDLVFDQRLLTLSYLMADGTEIPLEIQAGNHDGAGLRTLTFDPETADGNRLFPDMTQVKSVRINDRVIALDR